MIASPGSELDDAEVRSAIERGFGERSGIAHGYAELLRTRGIERGLLGPREADRIWTRHLLNSVALADLVPADARVIDLGSGAGLPGIPLAIARPDLHMVLLEPMQRRVDYLGECLAVLELPNVEIQHSRAEDGVTPLADCVVARAIASLDKLMRLSSQLLVDGGVLLALKGAAAAGEVEKLRRESGLDAEVLRVAAPGESATVVRLVRPPQIRPKNRLRRVGSGQPGLKSAGAKSAGAKSAGARRAGRGST